jgi:hypothetical protein
MPENQAREVVNRWVSFGKLVSSWLVVSPFAHGDKTGVREGLRRSQFGGGVTSRVHFCTVLGPSASDFGTGIIGVKTVRRFPSIGRAVVGLGGSLLKKFPPRDDEC